MTRDERLDFCSICTHRKLDGEGGIICGLNNQLADFDIFCDAFVEDTNKTVNYEIRTKINDRTIRASRGMRFFNALIDSIIILLLSSIVEQILDAVVASPSGFADENSYIYSIAGFFVVLFYYALFEFKTGRTIGKLITKTRVVTISGEAPSFVAILIRTFCRFIPFEDFSFLVSNKSGWHDKLSNTKVVYL